MELCMEIELNSRKTFSEKNVSGPTGKKNESDYGELSHLANVRWLSRSIFLQRFKDLQQNVKDFFGIKDEAYVELTDDVW
ncbi:hypothetical protein TNCT_175461 [Trichonephila clavata]|uniref:Uncharacterized protein n=1 Tax=Trichonephila clavata TaxID=2740835 RepID=A0A8X6HLJ9_TRICU|nr:hypothetical protein TNCT_175461 [Trichonephila clavata]